MCLSKWELRSHIRLTSIPPNTIRQTTPRPTNNTPQSTSTPTPYTQGVNPEDIQKPTKMQANYSSDNPPYTSAEKQWLKTHWGSEFHFLRCYQLSIYDEGDREEGRRIARALMEADGQSER